MNGYYTSPHTNSHSPPAGLFYLGASSSLLSTSPLHSQATDGRDVQMETILAKTNESLEWSGNSFRFECLESLPRSTSSTSTDPSPPSRAHVSHHQWAIVCALIPVVHVPFIKSTAISSP